LVFLKIIWKTTEYYNYEAIQEQKSLSTKLSEIESKIGRLKENLKEVLSILEQLIRSLA